MYYNNYDSSDNFEKIFFWFSNDLLSSWIWRLPEKSKPGSIKVIVIQMKSYSKPIDNGHADQKSTSTARNVLERYVLFNFENRYVTKSGAIVWFLLDFYP
jgi:hypothetical protein